MTQAADDFEALFDEVAAQRTQTVAVLETVPMNADAEAANAGNAAGQPADDADDADGAEDQSGKPMYERLGGIVRLLHDSLRELGYDRSLSNVAAQINDATDRLGYIASLTEQAANKVLNAVDVGMPAQDALAQKAKEMDERWARLFEGKLGISEFRLLAGDSKQFAGAVLESTEAEKARLLDIMMAQDFQDITGQLIKKIVTIANTAERELAQLLRDNAPAELKTAIAATEVKPAELMNGPSAPSAAMGQDDVDGLLAELGF